MEKICWANSDFNSSDVVIVGIPDESRSHSLREGTSMAPDRIRRISNLRDSYKRLDQVSKGFPYDRISKNICDFGNIAREQISQTFQKIIDSKKVPITVGGDHSITPSIIRSMSKKFENISFVYFDAHPDFVTSTTNYYGSVFGDVLPYIKKSSSIQIGTRTPELEELDNLREHQIAVITPYEIEKKGISEISNQILETVGNNIYVSFDMDCIDPAHAPGVSVPVPLGLSGTQAQFLLKNLARQGIIGMDLVEVCPPFDVDDRTSHLASRIISEIISSMK